MSGVVALRSVEFGTYVSMNGIGITHHREEPYKDTIKVAEHVQSLETFYPHGNDDGTFSFESTIFPNVFLTLNGHGVPPGTAIHGGVTPKVVNVQGVAGIGERIEIVHLDV